MTLAKMGIAAILGVALALFVTAKTVDHLVGIAGGNAEQFAEYEP